MFSDHVKILVDGAFFSLNMQVIFYSVLVMKPLEKMNTNTTSTLVSLCIKGFFISFLWILWGFEELIWCFSGGFLGGCGGFPGVLGVFSGGFQEFSRGFLGVFQWFSWFFRGFLGVFHGFSGVLHGDFRGFSFASTGIFHGFSGGGGSDFFQGSSSLFQGFFGLWLQVTNSKIVIAYLCNIPN